jgi:thiol-disulfide isomerase/thioredoxin
MTSGSRAYARSFSLRILKIETETEMHHPLAAFLALLTLPRGLTRSKRRPRARRALGAILVGAIVLLTASPVLGLGAGDPAAPLDGKSVNGDETLSLAEHRGKVVYLDFWASWCKPCTVAIPLIEEMRAEFPAKDFQILAVNLDKNPKQAVKFLRKHPVGYPSVSDPRGQLPRKFGLETMPTSYLIDRDGVIRYVHKGFRKDDIGELRKRIAKLVAK